MNSFFEDGTEKTYAQWWRAWLGQPIGQAISFSVDKTEERYGQWQRAWIGQPFRPDKSCPTI